VKARSERTYSKRPKDTPSIQSQKLKLVEEFAQLDREISNFKHKISRHEKLRGLILEWNQDLPADDERTLTAKTCDIIITSRDRIRSVTLAGKKALLKLWGTNRFIAKCQVHLKSLPDPKDEDGQYTVLESTGPRHLKVVERAQAATTAR